MPHEILRRHIHPTIARRVGSESKICVLSGRDVFATMGNEKSIVMACNPRIAHVIPGIMRAAEELDALVIFELTATEGGLDGGYTGQTPEIFVQTLLEQAERYSFTRPFVIHADHITVKDSSETQLTDAVRLIEAQRTAGFTSFALDASFNPLAENIRIVSTLARQLVDAGYGLEVELGEVPAVGSESSLTTVEEAEAFLDGLACNGVIPHLLAINNGSHTGNYLDGQMVQIDLERTAAIHATAMARGVSGLVQHGITGTPLHLVGRLAEYGVRKGNIGTLWQNVAHAGLPLDLMDAIRRWSRDNGRDIKYATGVFRHDIDAIPEENVKLIAEMAYREAREFIAAFHGKGSATRLAHLLGTSRCG